MTTLHRGRTFTASIAALAVVTGGMLVPQATAQEMGECIISEADFDWALRDSWNNYIYGPIANGDATFEGGVSKIDSDVRSEISYNFDAINNEVDGDTVILDVDGGVHFQGHDYGEGSILDNELTDFRLELEGTSAVLYADLYYREFIDTQTVGDWITTPNVALGEWTLTVPVEVSEGEVEFASAGNGKFASQDAIDSFAGFYTAPDNDRIAPLSGSFTVADCDGDTGNGDGGNGGNGDGGNGGNGDGGNGTPSEDASSDLSSSFDDLSSGENLSSAEGGQGLYSNLLGLVSVGGILAVFAGMVYYVHQNFSF